MKKPISVLLCLCILLCASGVNTSALDIESQETFDRVDIIVKTVEVYYQLPAGKCYHEIYAIQECGYSGAALQKNIGGQWVTLDVNSTEPVGTGTFRWKLLFMEYQIGGLDPVVTPGVTTVFINGEDCGTIDGDYCAYTKPFEVGEEKLPNPIAVKEIRIEGFREPVIGEKPVQYNEMTVICPGIEDKPVSVYLYIIKTDLNDEITYDPETIESDCLYSYYFEILLNYNPSRSQHYVYDDNVKLYINGKKYKPSKGTNDIVDIGITLNLNYVLSNRKGIAGKIESFFNYFLIRFRSILNSYPVLISAIKSNIRLSLVYPELFNTHYYIEFFTMFINPKYWIKQYLYFIS